VITRYLKEKSSLADEAEQVVKCLKKRVTVNKHVLRPHGPHAEGKGRTCSDGKDNDCDGLADCADPDCTGNRSCR